MTIIMKYTVQLIIKCEMIYNNILPAETMKTKLSQFMMVVVLLVESSRAVCTAPFTNISSNSGSYCVKCDTSCATCYDDSLDGCVTCPDDFTIDTLLGYCYPPQNMQIQTLQSSYHFYGFDPAGNWTGGQQTNCLYTTLLTLASGSTYLENVIYLDPHYGLRLLVSTWWLTLGAATNTFIYLEVLLPDGTTHLLTKNIQFSSAQAPANNSVYCTGSYAYNYDSGMFNGSSSPYVTIRFSSGSDSWGIRQFIFIQYLCDMTYCATCNGSSWDDCLSCSDSKRVVYGTGECRCDPIQSYFQHPNVNQCVWPCPSYPSTGQYYGDATTQLCVSQCPLSNTLARGTYFADDTSGLCVSECPTTASFGTEAAKDYFHDVVNRRCVTNCPTAQPYSYWVNRTCLASCPSGYYKLESNMSCVSTCLLSQTIPLYKDDNLGACVDECVGLDWWADDLTGKCTSTCSGSQYFQDNSTTRNKCVHVCPAPLYFGDLTLGKCLDYCYGSNFGDTHPTSSRHCIGVCSGGYFGLLTGNRQCVKTCPNQTWGEIIHYTCVVAPTDCDAGKFADNYTHMCVGSSACSLKQYSTSTGRVCVTKCPDGEYGNPTTMHCDTGCSGAYFADPGLNLCVQVCKTANLYADTGSNNRCVSVCNQSVSTKYRQFDSRKCVAYCPDDPYTFSDIEQQACVYNCSTGLYKDDLSNPADKRCVQKCISPNWGDNSTGYGICVARCPQNPPLFGDTVYGYRICVEVCRYGLFGDQSPTGDRECLRQCPPGYYAQDDQTRRCVLRCNTTTYGYNTTVRVCVFPDQCPAGRVGDPSTNMCTNLCPPSQGTFADDIVSWQCVKNCPVNNSVLYFADPTDRWCRDTCTASRNLFGNNYTQTCQQECIDPNSFADVNSFFRYCIAECTNTLTDLWYRNNYTKTCVLPNDCPTDYFADNLTKNCVAKCPVKNGSQTWGNQPTKTCVTKCYSSRWADLSTGIPLCVVLCPQLPPAWSYDPTMECVNMCPGDLWGEDYTRTCTPTCPLDPNDSQIYTYAYNITKRCLLHCPNGYFSDKNDRMCWSDPVNCSYGWGDPFNNSCTTRCTGPSPWDSFGDNVTHLCTVRCSVDSYADNYTGTRICVQVCPGQYDVDGTYNGTVADSYGDNSTQSCVLHCVSPNTWADWQTHRCESRCTGDLNTTVPTYSENKHGRCVIALWCPILPDILYGDNNTRSCLTACYYNGSYTEWADNITRTCIPQCLNYSGFNTTTPYNGIQTRFFGDLSTSKPICVIACPEAPRLFGENSTNKCVSQCPDNQYGDQTGNRTCLPFCPIINGAIWFTQITQHICVLKCEDGTWGNVHGRPHCETVPTDCIIGEYADNSTNLCVPLCPEDHDYFGDPSTRLCVVTCPRLLSRVENSTASINMSAGYLYADYSTRLCVYRCPEDFGPFGSFGDNSTHTCVYRCPPNSYGDWQTAQRHCVAVCTAGTFADDLTMTCVSQCPASPPYFGQTTNWTCVSTCPDGTWASTTNRQCVPNCPANQFRFNGTKYECVNICPSNPDLYGDPNTWNCVYACTANTLYPFADPTDRMCKSSCLPLFQYNGRCMKLCPLGYFANLEGNCVIPAQCNTTLYADNATTKCISPCVGGAFADPNSRYCIAICPDGWYGDGTDCVQNCLTPGTSSSNITQTCNSACPNRTYSENSTCKPTCDYGYANNVTGICSANCPLNLYSDPLTHLCSAVCSDSANYFRDTNTGKCVNDCSPQFKDPITGNCVTRCSTGYWGNTGNMTCIASCITGQYGFEDTNQRTCYAPLNLPGHAGNIFGDPETGQYVTVCQVAPNIYFGDRVQHECVTVCSNHTGTSYYGDFTTRQCEPVCTNTTFYTADPQTSRCTFRCTLGTYRFNNTPICVPICPVGFADPTTGICVAECPGWADSWGFFNTTSTQRICVTTCPDKYFANPTNRTCGLTCPSPYFADNNTHQCVIDCLNSFADLSSNICVTHCTSNLYPNADNSSNKCVATCPSSPDYYSDNHVCVFYCTTATYFADYSTRSCVGRCPNVTDGNTYGDETTGRCVLKCPLGYYADNSTNKCVPTCPTGSYGHNGSRVCYSACPINQSLYADPYTHLCSYTCSNNSFGSQISQECVGTCDGNYWGDPLTTLCVATCPSSIYSFGQNNTRTCVTSCAGYSGFADNYTRICRDVCQNLSIWTTFADPTTMSCVRICPSSYYMENTTNECRTSCISGYADNYSRYCVLRCPSDPDSYGDTLNQICRYECLRGEFTDNSTNLCVPQCPPTPDYYGDPETGRCVVWCTQGSYAQVSSRRCVPRCNLYQYADNLTRRCQSDCPPSQSTFADDTTNRCVRICPIDYWADNSTQSCVSYCPNITVSGVSVDTYADNITHYCVLQCPAPNFGRKDLNRCIPQCPASPNLFGHPSGRICVSNCFSVGPIIYFADDTTRLCVQKCPLNRWADSSTFTCVATCPPGEFRNSIDQTCTTNCPSIPDLYGDSSTWNCVSVCPPNSYAVVDGSGFRICVSNCALYGLIKDNTTNKCVSLTSCPTSPFMYGDLNAGACVLHCSIQYFADNKTQTCVFTCPADWELFGSTDTYDCVNLCPADSFADELYAARPRSCRSTCSNGYFSDNETSTCVQHCSEIKPYYYEDVPSGTCVLVCPGQSYAHNVDQTCKYSTLTASGYVSTCPSPYFAERLSKSCVLQCPLNYYANPDNLYCELACTGTYYADKIIRACTTTCSFNYYKLNSNSAAQVCVQFCPSPYFAQNSSKSCELGCSSLLALPSTRTCESYCPQPYYADWVLHECLLTCAPKFANEETRTCIDPCVAPAYSNPINFTCDLICPLHYFGRNGTRSCSTTCLLGSFADPYSRICVAQCPINPMLFADTRSNECLTFCLSPLYADETSRSCVSGCPNISGAIYLADGFSRRCVLECVSQTGTFADYANNVCTNFCPNGTFASNFTKQCVPVCPNSPNDTFADNTTHICMDVCRVGYGNAATLNCVASCVLPLFADPITRICVRQCSIGYFAQNSTATCVPQCQAGSYADPTTYRCVGSCPANQNLYSYDTNWTCLSSCPNGYFANQNNSKCVQICDSISGMYALENSNVCVMECPYPYRGYAPNHTCILSCPTLYFYDSIINVCTHCPLQCSACTSLTMCVSCQPGYNLFNGACSLNCRPNNGIITYADPSTNNCVQTCPPPYFGDNSSYACIGTCPPKQYGNSTLHLCQNCPQTCSQCSNLTFCSACESNATMAIDNMCYSHCSPTAQYYYNSLCYVICPPGTYVSYTNVHCVACSDLCATCITSASFCLSCNGRYLHNNLCLTECPSGYYGALDFTCKQCTSTTVSICAAPLTFNTSVSIENYQYVVQIKFNQDVSIQKQIEDILRVQLQVTRRLLTTLADLINNGVSYTYKILSDGTIKLYLNIPVDLVNPVFTVKFTDPTAVLAINSGLPLQNVDSEFTITKVEYYPPQSSSQAGILKAANFTIIFILLLCCATILFTDTIVKPLQMLQIMFFHALATIPMPANLYFFLLQFKLSLLQFLPNWPAKPIAKDIVLYPNATQKTVDVFVDYNWFRNVGQIFFMIVIWFGMWAIFMILSNKRVIENKIWQKAFETVSNQRFGFSVINDVFSIFYVPILWFGFSQFQTLFGSGYLGFNGFICLIFVLASISLPFLLFLVWWKKGEQQIQQKFPFMVSRINLDKPKASLDIPITYCYLILCVIWLVGLDIKSQAQMILLILTNIAYFTYLAVIRPFKIHINTIFGMLWCLVLIAIESFMLYFKLSNASRTSSSKTITANTLLIVISVILMLFIIWCIWRSIYQMSEILKFFKQSQFYKHYADPDIQEQSEKSEIFQKFQKNATLIDQPVLGEVIVEKIIRQCNQKGQNVIKIRKKVLKKKKKVTKKKGQKLASQQPQQEKQFVRINKVNAFDYDYDEDFKVKNKKQTMKRVFDDDLRDIVSQDQQPMKPTAKQIDKKNIEKILKMQKDQKMIRNLDQLMSENNSQQNYYDEIVEQSKQKSSQNNSVQQQASEAKKLFVKQKLSGKNEKIQLQLLKNSYAPLRNSISQKSSQKGQQGQQQQQQQIQQHPKKQAINHSFKKASDKQQQNYEFFVRSNTNQSDFGLLRNSHKQQQEQGPSQYQKSLGSTQKLTDNLHPQQNLLRSQTNVSLPEKSLGTTEQHSKHSNKLFLYPRSNTHDTIPEKQIKMNRNYSDQQLQKGFPRSNTNQSDVILLRPQIQENNDEQLEHQQQYKKIKPKGSEKTKNYLYPRTNTADLLINIPDKIDQEDEHIETYRQKDKKQTKQNHRQQVNWNLDEQDQHESKKTQNKNLYGKYEDQSFNQLQSSEFEQQKNKKIQNQSFRAINFETHSQDNVENKQQKQQKIQEVIKKKPKGIEQLIEEEQANKKKKLMFLFDQFEEDQ